MASPKRLPSTGSPTRTGRTITMRVGVWLLALAIVPLTGTVWFAANEVQLVEESNRQADAVAEATEELVLLTELRATVLDERNWTGASYGVSDLGFTPQLVKATRSPPALMSPARSGFSRQRPSLARRSPCR